MELMADLAGKRNIPVIVNIHNVDLAKRFCHRMIGMTGGKVVFDGPPSALTDDNLKQIYGGENWIE
jgi:phosphonate transport system ATP-binding protein